MFFNQLDKLIYTSPLDKKFDPLALYRKLITSRGGVINDRLSIWSDETATSFNKAMAEEELVAISRQSFELKPFTEEDGVTDGVALNCLVDFLEWIEKNG